MEVFESFHMSRRETASFTLGLVSVIVWVVAEIPQIITNYKAKSTDGLSATFLITWIIGDLFNLFGCILEPATLPTQLYMAVLYTFVTVALGSQSIYYGYIYPQSQYKRQLKVETPTKDGYVEKVSDAEQSHGFDDFSRGADPSSPIPLPARLPSISTGRELFYQSARSLTMTRTPTSGSLLAQRMTPNSPFLDSMKENLLGSAFARQSAPSLKIKSTLCLVSTLSFFGVINLYKSLDKGINPMVSNPRQQFVVYVGRKLFQENGASGNSSIGTYLGWAMTFLYLSGRMPQIWLNIRRGHAEGLNPLMFLFALIGNATYVASILVSSLNWSNIRPNLPWLVDAGGYFDAIFIFSLPNLPRPVNKYKHQTASYGGGNNDIQLMINIGEFLQFQPDLDYFIKLTDMMYVRRNLSISPPSWPRYVNLKLNW